MIARIALPKNKDEKWLNHVCMNEINMYRNTLAA